MDLRESFVKMLVAFKIHRTESYYLSLSLVPPMKLEAHAHVTCDSFQITV